MKFVRKTVVTQISKIASHEKVVVKMSSMLNDIE